MAAHLDWDIFYKLIYYHLLPSRLLTEVIVSNCYNINWDILFWTLIGKIYHPSEILLGWHIAFKALRTNYKGGHVLQRPWVDFFIHNIFLMKFLLEFLTELICKIINKRQHAVPLSVCSSKSLYNVYFICEVFYLCSILSV